MAEEIIETEEIIEFSEEGTIRDKTQAPERGNNSFLSIGELYETILRHPDWRVVEATDDKDSCHPLKHSYSKENGLRFEYDGASTPMHHEAMCESIIALCGPDPMDDAEYEVPVLVQEIYGEGWGAHDAHKVKKTSLSSSAKWIKLHPIEETDR